MSVDAAELVDVAIDLDQAAPSEVTAQAETLPNGEASDFDPGDDGFDVKAWEHAQQRAAQILKPAPRPMPPVELPTTTLCMVVKATIYQGLTRMRGEVLDEASNRRVGLLERIGTMARLPYGVTLLGCACGRRWVSQEAMDRHECPEPEPTVEPTPQKKGGAKKA